MADFGDPPWGVYYDTLYPPRLVDEFGRFWMASAIVDIVRRLWEQREALRVELSGDPLARGVVLDAVRSIAHGACVRCLWIDRPGFSMDDAGWRVAAEHAASEHVCTDADPATDSTP